MKMLNLHWGLTLANKVPLVHVKQKTDNQTEDDENAASMMSNKIRHQHKSAPWKRDWNNANDTMISSIKTIYPLRHADNHFLKKSKMLTDLMKRIDHPESLNTVFFVICGIFLFLAISITGAVSVFYRKGNTVSALQKSEQEDVDDIDY